MNWSNRNALATVLAASLAIGPAIAHAQITPPFEAVPDLADEPLPEWHPPPPRHDVVHLDVGPELKQAHTTRQAGLWLISIGGAMLFAAGMLYAHAIELNDDAGRYHNNVMVGDNGQYTVLPINIFDPNIEDQKDLALNGSRSLLVIGGAFAVTGFAIFGVGQARIRAHHKKNPRDPLPPLSGYDQVK